MYVRIPSARTSYRRTFTPPINVHRLVSGRTSTTLEAYIQYQEKLYISSLRLHFLVRLSVKLHTFMDDFLRFYTFLRTTFCCFPTEISIFAVVFPHKSVENKTLFPHKNVRIPILFPHKNAKDMKRFIYNQLKNWKLSSNRKPLIMYGA